MRNRNRCSWFDPDLILFSTPTPFGHDAEGWFKDGDYQVTLRRFARGDLDPSTRPAPCLMRDEEFDWTCLLPAGHETKHLPCSRELALVAAIDEVEVRRAS